MKPPTCIDDNLSLNRIAFHHTIMLASFRIRVYTLAPICRPYILSHRHYATRERNSDRIPTNDPSPPEPVQNVSDSNAIPISPQGMRDSSLPLQEMPEDSERQRVMQAPNRKEPWSRSQQPRERAMSGPRFEQTIMEYQVGCRADMALSRSCFDRANLTNSIADILS